MGVRIDGGSDKISADDGTLLVDGIHGTYASGNSIAGFSTALAVSGFANHFYKTQAEATVSAGTSVSIEANDTNCGNTVFTRLNRINVGAGATFHVGAGTTLVLNCLGVF
tara:strand:- start:817 stop:1146 length:330 start_codon:yes stop_codon:yes gene_type:complete